jgi:hypothetical protein
VRIGDGAARQRKTRWVERREEGISGGGSGGGGGSGFGSGFGSDGLCIREDKKGEEISQIISDVKPRRGERKNDAPDSYE